VWPDRADGTFAPVAVENSPVLSRELGAWTNSPVHINGTVAGYKPNNVIEIKDATGSIRAHVLHLGGIRLNGRVDLWGFLTLTADGPVLRDAYFEAARTATRTAPPADSRGSSALLTQNTFTKVSDITRLGRAKAGQHLPARLVGVVTYADPEWRTVFFQDQGGAIYADCSQKDVRAGQWVQLTGQTDAGGFAPQLVNCTIKILGMTNLPVATQSDLEDLASGHLDARWVEMQGVVRRVSQEWGHVNLTLTTPKGRFRVIVPTADSQPLPLQLIDALVSVQGACGSELNARGQLIGVMLHAPSLEQIRVVEGVPPDPFGVRGTPIATVSTLDPERLTGRRVKVGGTVTMTTQNGDLFIQDNSGGILVTPQENHRIRERDVVEVLGFPAVGDFSPYLEEGTLRVTGKGTLPEPKKLTAEQIMTRGTNDGQRVQIEAQLVQTVARSARPKVVLQDGAILFTAHLTRTLGADRLSELPPGSVLRLEGVCVIQGGENHEPASFRLLIAHAAH